MARIRPPSLRWLLAALLMGLLAACATGPRISSDADPRADFSAYRSFAFYSPLAIEREGYASLVSGRMKAAARAEMEARGYRYSESDPDLWLNINAYMQPRTSVSTTLVPASPRMSSTASMSVIPLTSRSSILTMRSPA